MAPIVGIDLGTTNSLVAVYEDGAPRVLAPAGEAPLLPSAVRYEADGDGVRTIVGDRARDEAVDFPRTTVTSVKRLMGRSIRDVALDLPYLFYDIVECGQGAGEMAYVRLPIRDGLTLSPQEISAVILKALKERAERVLDGDVTKAVVTVPAYFDDAQRQATRDAGRMAGIEVVRIINEPTAAALAYGLGMRAQAKPQHVAVYDLGGGTFDVSILRLTPGEERAFFQVLSTAGDTRLGGDDVDRSLVSLFAREIGKQFPITFDGMTARTKQALLDFARQVKHRLSDEAEADVQIDLGEGRVYERIITRGELETMAGAFVERTLACCRGAMRDAARQLAGAPVDAAILVGGSTRMPLVRRAVQEFFGVAPYTALDPDQVVALGAAVQAGIMDGRAQGSLLLDVLPLSLGVETVGGGVAKLIMRNSTVPVRATEQFSTSVDGQTSIKLTVLQGEREMAADCRTLGTFHLAGLPPMPAGLPQVEVTFMVDVNGMLDVSAVERRSGRRAAIQVIPNHGLTRDEVARIEAESLEHAAEDMNHHRIVDLAANSKLDLKWISERFDRFRDELEPEYAEELATRIDALREFVRQAEKDWTAVDANAFLDAKTALDRASVRLQEIGIAHSLREQEPG